MYVLRPCLFSFQLFIFYFLLLRACFLCLVFFSGGRPSRNNDRGHPGRSGGVPGGGACLREGGGQGEGAGRRVSGPGPREAQEGQHLARAEQEEAVLQGAAE